MAEPRWRLWVDCGIGVALIAVGWQDDYKPMLLVGGLLVGCCVKEACDRKLAAMGRLQQVIDRIATPVFSESRDKENLNDG